MPARPARRWCSNWLAPTTPYSGAIPGRAHSSVRPTTSVRCRRWRAHRSVPLGSASPPSTERSPRPPSVRSGANRTAAARIPRSARGDRRARARSWSDPGAPAPRYWSPRAHRCRSRLPFRIVLPGDDVVSSSRIWGDSSRGVDALAGAVRGRHASPGRTPVFFDEGELRRRSGHARMVWTPANAVRSSRDDSRCFGACASHTCMRSHEVYEPRSSRSNAPHIPLAPARMRDRTLRPPPPARPSPARLEDRWAT